MKPNHFTILVEQRNAKDTFGFGDLVLVHSECAGGHISQTEDYHGRWWYLKCQRCSCKVQIEPGNDSTGAVVLTSVDGVTRSVTALYQECSVVRQPE